MPRQRWWELEGDELANEVVRIADALESDQEHRRSRAQNAISVYENRRLNRLSAGAYSASTEKFLRLPLCRSLCDTVLAEIAGRQRPKPQFMTSGADWQEQRRARRMDRFVEAVLHQQQGRYVNGWELLSDCFHDATKVGTGVCKVYVDGDGEEPKLRLERVRDTELYVDPREAEHGDPLNLVHIYEMDEDKALECFVKNGTDADGNELTEERKEVLRHAISSAASSDTTEYEANAGTARLARVIKVREIWRKPLSKDRPGKHAFCISGATLDVEDWTEPDFPFVFFRWAPETWGFWAQGLIEEAEPMQDELNECVDRMSERISLCANKRVYVPESANISEEMMQANEAENIIYYAGGQPPHETQTSPFTPAEFEWTQWVKSLGYELPGVSQMSATGRKETGIDSGVAIRTTQDLAAKRFAVKARYSYEYPFVSLARRIVAAVAAWCDATGQDFVAGMPKGEAYDEVRWADAKLSSSYDIKVGPVSSLPNSAEGIRQYAQELFNAGAIGRLKFLRIIDWPDLDTDLQRETAEHDYAEWLIDRFLDADEDSEGDVYESPDGFLQSPQAQLVQFAQAYFQAKRKRAPELNLELLRRYTTALVEMIERAQAPAQPAPGMAPPAGAAPAVPPPGGVAPAGMAPPMTPGPVPGMEAA